MKKVLLTATVQSHICQFHKPLVKVLHEHHYEVHVAARNNLAEKNGLKLDFVDRVFDIPFERSPLSRKNIAAYQEMKKVIHHTHYDVIHCNTPMGGIVTRLAGKAARKKGTKLFYTAHGFHFYEGAPKQNWAVYYPIEKFFANHYTDKLITITQEDFKLAKEKFKCHTEYIHGVGLNTKKYTILSENEKMDIRQKMGFSPQRTLILCVGELLANKNQSTVIRAMEKVVQKHPNSTLMLAGNGANLENLQQLAAELNLQENILFLGYTTELEKYLNIADIVVSCSFREGLPVNIMEAMYCKKPTVTSINRGHKELVRDGETGYLVAPTDAAGVAEKLTFYIENPHIRKRFGEKGYHFIQAFTDKSVGDELKEIYDMK